MLAVLVAPLTHPPARPRPHPVGAFLHPQGERPVLTYAEWITDFISDGDLHLTDSDVPMRATVFIAPAGHLVRLDGSAIR